jgi:hypothetical protein
MKPAALRQVAARPYGGSGRQIPGVPGVRTAADRHAMWDGNSLKAGQGLRAPWWRNTSASATSVPQE